MTADLTRPGDPAQPLDMLAVVGALSSLVLTTEDVESFLHEVVTMAADVVVPPAACGITVRRDGRPLTVACSDGRAERLDETQYGAGEGPCLDTLASGELNEIVDLAEETRWPEYVPRARAQGLRSSLSVPLTVDGSTAGALNVYGFSPHAFGAPERQKVEVFAAQAATALLLTMRHAEQAAVARQLEAALASRTVIDQAIGILMGQQRCAADQAFALLRKHSQNHNRKLRDVAAEVITRVSGSPPSASPAFRRSGDR